MVAMRIPFDVITVRDFSIYALLAVSVFLSGASPAAAQGNQPASLAETLVTKGRLENGIVACQACHRGAGEGDASSGFGNLTGLTREYLSKQLKDFQSGARENRIMQVVAKNLTAPDIDALSLYYSDLKPQLTRKPHPRSASLCDNARRAGRRRARHSGVHFLVHGAEARSADNTLPILFGQHPLYIKNQLSAWQNGSRKNDACSVMSDIARKLSGTEIDALAIYFARLPRSAQ